MYLLRDKCGHLQVKRSWWTLSMIFIVWGKQRRPVHTMHILPITTTVRSVSINAQPSEAWAVALHPSRRCLNAWRMFSWFPNHLCTVKIVAPPIDASRMLPKQGLASTVLLEVNVQHWSWNSPKKERFHRCEMSWKLRLLRKHKIDSLLSSSGILVYQFPCRFLCGGQILGCVMRANNVLVVSVLHFNL